MIYFLATSQNIIIKLKKAFKEGNRVELEIKLVVNIDEINLKKAGVSKEDLMDDLVVYSFGECDGFLLTREGKVGDAEHLYFLDNCEVLDIKELE